MKRISLVLIILFATAAASGADVRKQTFTFPAGGDRISVDLPVGDLVVLPSNAAQIRVDMTIRCSSTSSRCKEMAKEIELVSDRSGSSLDLEIDGYPEHSSGGGLPSVDLTIWIPASTELHSEVGVGDTTVTGVEGNIDVQCGVGDVTLSALESKVRSIHIESGIGSAKLFVKKRPVEVPGFLFLGHELDWHEGRGDARVDVEAGVGSVRVSID